MPAGPHLALPFALAAAAVAAVVPVAAPAAVPVVVPGAVPAAADPPALAVVASPPAGSRVAGPARPPRFSWPLRPRPVVARRFAVGPHPWSPGHRGVDLAGAAGSAVYAAAAGRVTVAGPVAGTGVVVVDHGGLRTTYQPVTASVPVGTTVATGTRIGTLDAGPSHCGSPCLHWGAIRGEVYVDPLPLVGALGPAVLLPLSPAR